MHLRFTAMLGPMRTSEGRGAPALARFFTLVGSASVAVACGTAINLPNQLSVCEAAWLPVGADEVTPAGFSVGDLGTFLAEPREVAVDWNEEAITVGPSDTVLVAFGVDAERATLGEIGPGDLGCPEGWALRVPVSGTIQTAGLLESTALAGEVWAWLLADDGFKIESEGAPVLDAAYEPELLAAAQDAMGTDATLSTWMAAFMGSFATGRTGVGFEFGLEDGTSGSAALAQGQWGPPDDPDASP